MEDDHTRTHEMKIQQAKRETAERRFAEEEETDPGTATHQRRADKAAYLKEKLAEREAAEQRGR